MSTEMMLWLNYLLIASQLKITKCTSLKMKWEESWVSSRNWIHLSNLNNHLKNNSHKIRVKIFAVEVDRKGVEIRKNRMENNQKTNHIKIWKNKKKKILKGGPKVQRIKRKIFLRMKLHTKQIFIQYLKSYFNWDL